ncbi:Hypothetical_protein [Hexamita inflata]|uniref:Hypothetical_protein n=1 Tax=Hexamita inflata TaxID=28002 RepID=A0AA86NAV3_9EUKA|nr:Hypothetical protein HINF_LOCUS3458 [Hexamita inflata]
MVLVSFQSELVSLLSEIHATTDSSNVTDFNQNWNMLVLFLAAVFMKLYSGIITVRTQLSAVKGFVDTTVTTKRILVCIIRTIFRLQKNVHSQLYICTPQIIHNSDGNNRKYTKSKMTM